MGNVTVLHEINGFVERSLEALLVLDDAVENFTLQKEWMGVVVLVRGGGGSEVRHNLWAIRMLGGTAKLAFADKGALSNVTLGKPYF